MNGKIVFLHLSDLHFGDENETDSAKRTNTLNELLQTLKNLPPGWKPQSISISGDIGWHGLENDYNIAQAWLGKLLKTLALAANDIIPAPGNHDINLKIAAAVAVPAADIHADKLLDLDSLEIASIPFKGFEDFCKKMNIPPLNLGSKSSYLAGSRVQNGITWLVLNSAWFCREGRKEKLHIGLPHLEVMTASESWKKRDIPTIGLLHHPPPHLHDEELNSYGSRRNTYDFLAGECHMILSGHVHGMLTEPDSKFQKSYLFTGGSSYSAETVRNNVSIFRLDISTGTIERRAYEWNPGDGEWEYREKYSQEFPFIGIGRKPGPQDLHCRLFTGSRRHYEDLCGENGRFRNLDISDIILQEPNKEWLDNPIKSFTGSRGGFSKEPLAAGGDKCTLLEVIPMLWQEGCKHAVVKGDGGMGKTVSLVRLWDEFTKKYHAGGPVPVFIQLNEINTVPEEKRMDFILSAIARDYFDGRVSADEIMRFLKEPRDVPAVLLLLDGFNEVTVDNKELLNQIRKLMEQARGVQVVITSRYDMRSAYGWGQIHLLELRGLEEKQVREYLEKKKSKMPEGGLLPLLRNPMMLTLYTSTCEVQGRYAGDFKEKVKTAGELLWNFMEAQAVKLPERLLDDQEEIARYRFLLKCLLPALGYEMEKAGLFSFTPEQLHGHVDDYCARFGREDFFDAFPEYAKYIRSLGLGVCADTIAKIDRREFLKDLMVNKLSLLVEAEGVYGFLHQDFRDYFAAVHVRNEMVMGFKVKQVPELLRQGTISFFVRRFLGQIEGEHRARPYLVKGQGWKLDENKDSYLYKVMDLCRGHFDGDMGFAVWNIVETWKEVRGELSGADLSGLDLGKVCLNGVVCSRYYKGKYVSAVFNESLLHEFNLFPQGHLSKVSSAVYSNDGKRILSASWDNSIREWDTATGQCLRTLRGHTNLVSSALYSSDDKKILSASWDNTIKEWDADTGESLNTLTGHKSYVASAVYRFDGKKILSASWDNTIKEWDTDTSKCVKTLTGHTYIVNSAVYSGDGKKILSASRDNTIKEWNAATGKYFKTLNTSANSIVYSGDGKKLLSASSGGTIKEWDAATGECLKTLRGHDKGVSSVVYSADGKKILSASEDKTIKEWDAATGECLKTYRGNNCGVNRAVYSSDGRRILFESEDHIINVWDAKSEQCLQICNKGEDEYELMQSETRDNQPKRQGLQLPTSEIHIKDSTTGETLKTLPYIAGLWIQGCSFARLHPGCRLSEEELQLLKMYGARGMKKK
jgi:WD40 repeat protein